MKSILIFTLPFFLFISCNKLQPNSLKKHKNFNADVIYGKDDRLDFYQILDPEWRRLTDSSIAIIDKRRMTLDGKNYLIKADTYGKVFHLCPDEAFYKQPSAAFCSGFLIGPDIVVTAGHCIRNEFNCENANFVFGYAYNTLDANPLLVKASDVYDCKEVIHTQANALSGSDFAIIRLNQVVQGYDPMPVRTQGKIDNNDQLTVIGYPSGLPGKLADRGVVRTNQENSYFVSTLDTYGGNSGSAVINSHSRLVEGLLVRGDTDFKYDPKTKCRRSNMCKEEACRGEDVVRISEVLNHLSPQDLFPAPEKEVAL